MNYKNRAQRVAFNEAADWLIGVKFERGVSRVCDSMFVSCTTESPYLSSCIRKYQACICQTSNKLNLK